MCWIAFIIREVYWFELQWELWTAKTLRVQVNYPKLTLNKLKTLCNPFFQFENPIRKNELRHQWPFVYGREVWVAWVIRGNTLKKDGVPIPMPEVCFLYFTELCAIGSKPIQTLSSGCLSSKNFRVLNWTFHPDLNWSTLFLLHSHRFQLSRFKRVLSTKRISHQTQTPNSKPKTTKLSNWVFITQIIIMPSIHQLILLHFSPCIPSNRILFLNWISVGSFIMFWDSECNSE